MKVMGYQSVIASLIIRAFRSWIIFALVTKMGIKTLTTSLGAHWAHRAWSPWVSQHALLSSCSLGWPCGLGSGSSLRAVKGPSCSPWLFGIELLLSNIFAEMIMQEKMELHVAMHPQSHFVECSVIDLTKVKHDMQCQFWLFLRGLKHLVFQNFTLISPVVHTQKNQDANLILGDVGAFGKENTGFKKRLEPTSWRN